MVEPTGTTTPATTTPATTGTTTPATTTPSTTGKEKPTGSNVATVTPTATYTPPAWLQPSSYEEQALDIIGKISLWVTALAAAISSLMVVVGAVPGLKESIKKMANKK